MNNKLKKEIQNNDNLTRFQKKVLIAALGIPKGQTRSYKWVADKCGVPGGARAVGNALSINPYAPMVPCHRVIASNGSIGGYSGGVAKKKRLLKGEGIIIRRGAPCGCPKL